MRIAPVAAVILLLAAAAGGYAYWTKYQEDRIPVGLARANGRIEVERVSISAKYGGRLAEVRFDEGDMVGKGEVAARLENSEALAQLTAAKASVHRAHQSLAKAQSDVGLREAELKLAETELRRTAELVRSNAATQAEFDRRSAQRDVAKAVLDGAKVAVEDARAAIEAAEARVTEMDATIAEMTLRAPVAGRVEYRLAQSGEMVSAGGRVLTLLDLSDVHMTIFLPTALAGRVALGSEARIVLDAAPDFIVPAKVSFVAGEAQFTPRYVETSSERDKMMYRVKLHIDPKLLESYRGYVKAGMTGNAYVTTSATASWPTNLIPRQPNAVQ